MKFELTNGPECRPTFTDEHGKVVAYPYAVRKIRSHLKITAAELGAKIGVSGRTINGWEQGRPPNFAGLIRLGTVIGPKTLNRIRVA